MTTIETHEAAETVAQLSAALAATITDAEPIDPAKAEREKPSTRQRREVGQAFTLTHPSRAPVLADWCEVAVPYAIAKKRGFLDGKEAAWVDSLTGKETPAILRTIRGRQSVFFDVLAEFHADGVTHGDILEAQAPWTHGFKLHPNLDGGALKFPRINGVEPDASGLRILKRTAAILRTLQTYDLGDGVFAYVECFARAMDPVVTFNFTLRRRTLTGNGKWVYCEIGFDGGPLIFEPEGVDGTGRRRTVSVGAGVMNWGHDLDWGTSPTWAFSAYWRGDQADLVTTQAEANAAFGEPVGMCNGWGGEDARWFAFAVRPRGEFRDDHRQKLAAGLQDRTDNYNAKRPMAQQLNAGQGGAQRFGQSIAGWALSPDPDAATLLRLAAEDELLRPVHWIDTQGRSLRAADRPGYKLVDREPHSVHTRGFDAEFGGWPPGTTPAGGRTTDDVLHIDDVALAAYLALRDDCWAMEDCYRQIVEREAAAVRLFAGWFTRARGFGRCMKSMADAAWLFAGDDTATTAQAAMLARLHIALGQWKGRTVTDPTRPVRPTDFQLDPRLLGGRHHGVIPYEESTVVAGLVAASHVLTGEARIACLGMAYHVANTIHALACHDDLGPWHAYGVGIPVGDDLGKLPPEGFDRTGTAAHAEWVHGTRDAGWTRWSIAASYLLGYVCEALSAELGVPVTSPYLADAQAVVQRSEAEPETLGNRDELDRFSACPVTLTQAAYVAAVDPRDTAGRL